MKVANERAKVQTLFEGQAELVRVGQFKEAAEAVTMRVAEFETPEGKAAAELLADKYARVHNLKLFLIRRLKAKKFEWGLKIGSNSRDITSASEKGLTVQGMSGIYKWERVTPSQMIRIVKWALKDTSKIKLRVLGEHWLATAIYCHLTLGERGMTAARDFANRAMDASEALIADVEKYLPPE